MEERRTKKSSAKGQWTWGGWKEKHVKGSSVIQGRRKEDES